MSVPWKRGKSSAYFFLSAIHLEMSSFDVLFQINLKSPVLCCWNSERPKYSFQRSGLCCQSLYRDSGFVFHWVPTNNEQNDAKKLRCKWVIVVTELSSIAVCGVNASETQNNCPNLLAPTCRSWFSISFGDALYEHPSCGHCKGRTRGIK